MVCDEGRSKVLLDACCFINTLMVVYVHPEQSALPPCKLP